MSQNNKRSIYLVLSSDSDTSIHENELATQAATTIRNQTNSLISVINRTGTNELYISSQDNLSHEQRWATPELTPLATKHAAYNSLATVGVRGCRSITLPYTVLK
ncbi:unnamed protein product, partial [Rotaria magnacalcarata]